MEATPMEWEQSEQINELAAALAKAQAKIKNAKKSSDNPFFKSKYADLAEVSDSCRGPLTDNGIAVVQGLVSRDGRCGVRTMLTHSSGQWMACYAFATPKDNGPQSFGSVTTYLRRYALASMAGVATEDDDGEKGEARDRDAKPPGANWNRNERSAPKAVAGSSATPKSSPTQSRPADSRGSTGATTTPTAGQTSTGDTGEVLDAGQLVELTERADDRWGKGAKTAFPSWLKAKFGTTDPANLTKTQAEEALGELLATAS